METTAAENQANYMKMLGPSVRKGIKKAVIEAAQAAVKLAKTDRNEEDRYNFVPIDTFYEKIAPELLKRNVFWTVTEESVVEYSDSVGWRLRFDLHLIDDGIEEEWPAVTRCTIFHPIDGPQACGKVFSYGEKVFMRSLLKLVTGEPDADVTGSKSIRPRQGSKKEQNSATISENKSPQAATKVARAIIADLEQAVSLEDMRNIFALNRAFIDAESVKDSSAYRELFTAWNTNFERVTKNGKQQS